MLRSIMVALDGSAFAEQALDLALNIAAKAEAPLDIVLVHVPYVSAETISDDPDNIDEAIHLRERQYLADLQHRLGRKGDVRLRFDHPVGAVVNQLEQEVAERKTGLVVMTTHGRGALSRFWLGSVADELVRRLAVPILLIRPDQATPPAKSPKSFQRILIPLDGSELSESILGPAQKLAQVMDSKCTLLRVVEVPPLLHTAGEDDEIEAMPQVKKLVATAKSSLDEVARGLDATSPATQTRVVVSSRVASAILNEAKETNADLIALATHGRSGVPRMFFGSVADKVLRGASVPVLLLSGGWHAARVGGNRKD